MILKDVSKVYKMRNKDVFAIHNVNLEIDENKGGFYVIKGHSGSGKTTLIQIIGLLNDINDGSYILDNVDIKDMNEQQKADLRAKKFGFIFQDYHLMSHLKAFENVMLPMILNKKMSMTKRKEKALTLLKKVSLEDKYDHYPNELSGGEQQRVSIARCLANEPNVILADEPTGNLDEENEKLIFDLLKEISLKKCVIVVSHTNLVDSYADKFFYMKEGEIVNEI